MAPEWQSGRFIERWLKEHNPETELDVEAALDALIKMPSACKTPLGAVGYSRGGYYALRLAAKRGKDIAAVDLCRTHAKIPARQKATRCLMSHQKLAPSRHRGYL